MSKWRRCDLIRHAHYYCMITPATPTCLALARPLALKWVWLLLDHGTTIVRLPIVSLYMQDILGVGLRILTDDWLDCRIHPIKQ